jgi:NAD(P)-dependent dehydrogenase (short-subunit alcohol dehydrogenase family)
MRAAGHGRILVSTSSAGLHGLHGLSAYAASKAALIGLARTLAAEGASRDVFCNAIAPYAATRMTAAHLEAGAHETMSPALVAPLVAALVSARSRINGEVIVTGLGWARRAATVELMPAVPAASYALQNDVATTRRELLQVPGVCAEFGDALQAFADYRDTVSGDLRPAAPRDSLA